MLDRKHIASLHIEKGKAGISDERYREILRDVAGVESSKDESLGEVEFRAIVKAIQGETAKLPGWKPGQLAKFRQYAQYCLLDDVAVRYQLYTVTGQMHEESEALDNEDFELAMAHMEEFMEGMIANRHIELPKSVDINYWRSRKPDGKLTSRQRYELSDVWAKLKQYLPPERQTYAYFSGIAQSVLRLRNAPEDIGELSRRQGVKLIEMLKRRLKQEEDRIQEAVPF